MASRPRPPTPSGKVRSAGTISTCPTGGASSFGFDYRLECCLQAARRRYGYFSLPILRRGALVGRLDAKAHRAEGRFEAKALHLGEGARPTGALLADLARAIGDCARWHGTPEVRVRRTVPAAVRAPLAALLR